MPAPKSGPLSRAELQSVWEAAVDKSYRDPLLVAGDGNGLEVVGQMLEQLARTSAGIDRSMQSLYILPWSGQTNPPAMGEAKSTVTLTFKRTGLVDKPLLLGKGLIFVEEETTDWGTPEGVVAHTGRLYTLLEDLVFHPGDVGPYDVPCEAERVGRGYDNPLPGTIKFIHQPAAAFTNDLATVTFAVATPGVPIRASIISAPQADMFVPEHVGQEVIFLAGANAGKVGRVTGFTAPVPPTIGSAVAIEVLHSFESFAFAGTFAVGEVVKFNSGGPVLGTGRVVGQRVVGGHLKVSYVLLSGVEGTTAVGASSGATATVSVALFRQLYTPETATAEWRVLDWAMDWGLTATNKLSPAGGCLAVLDALGRERAIFRSPRESDDSYRQRVATIADVVSPNAIRRALYRVLGNIPFCFREVGSSSLPGFFYDGDGNVAGTHTTPAAAALCDAYDTDVVVLNGALTLGGFIFQEPVQLETTVGQVLKVGGYFGRLAVANTQITIIRKTGAIPASLVGLRVRGLISGATFAPAVVVATPTVDARRFRLYFDYTEFRAFFLVGLPRLSLGEFGFAYDSFPTGAYDAAPFSAFYDGSPEGAAALYRNVYQAVDTVRAGGVGFALYLEDIGCP